MIPPTLPAMQCDLSSLLFVCVVLPVACVGLKRGRELAVELGHICKVRKVVGRARNRHRDRTGLVAELHALDDATFLAMFRMRKNSFFDLHDKCSSRIKIKTPLADKMAIISSGGAVDSLLLFAATIRWLAGGSMWDIAFMFRLSYKTVHAHKYCVMHAINHVLRGNIVFPQTEHGLQCLADGFASICSGKGKALLVLWLRLTLCAFSAKRQVPKKCRQRVYYHNCTGIQPQRLLCNYNVGFCGFESAFLVRFNVMLQQLARQYTLQLF